MTRETSMYLTTLPRYQIGKVTRSSDCCQVISLTRSQKEKPGRLGQNDLRDLQAESQKAPGDSLKIIQSSGSMSKFPEGCCGEVWGVHLGRSRYTSD